MNFLCYLVVDKDGEPSYISISGASKCVTTAHVNNAKHVIQQGKVLITNNGIPLPTAIEGLKLGKHFGAITIYNPSPNALELPIELYANTDILMLNMDEASALRKAKVTARSEAEDACIWFHDKGVPCVVMTMRESGAIVSVNVLDGGQGKCKF
jgi:ribokinase